MMSGLAGGLEVEQPEEVAAEPRERAGGTDRAATSPAAGLQ